MESTINEMDAVLDWYSTLPDDDVSACPVIVRDVFAHHAWDAFMRCHAIIGMPYFSMSHMNSEMYHDALSVLFVMQKMLDHVDVPRVVQLRAYVQRLIDHHNAQMCRYFERIDAAPCGGDLDNIRASKSARCESGKTYTHTGNVVV